MNDQEWLDEQLKNLGNSNLINLSPIELAHEKPISCKWYYLELLEDYLVLRFDFIAEVPIVSDDPESGWKETRLFTDSTIKKSAITLVDCAKFSDEDKYKIVIYVNGSSFDPTIFFLDQNKAENVYKIIRDWWLK